MERRWRLLSIGLLVAVFLAVIVLPLLLVLFSGIAGEKGYHFSFFSYILTDSYYKKAIIFTFEQALLSSAVTLLLGLPGAFIFSNYDFKWKAQLMAISTVPFVLPSVLVVLGFIIFFGNTGVVNSTLMDIFNLDAPPLRILYSWRAIVLAHAFYNIPLVFRLVSSVWTQIDDSMIEAARNVGASRFRILKDIELPFIRQGILSCMLLTFIYSFTSFAIVLALGGPQYATIEVSIYNLALFYGTYGLSSALALLQLVFLSVVVWIYMRIHIEKGGQGRKVLLSISSLSPAAKMGVVAYAVMIGAFLFGPMLGVCYASLQRTVLGQTHLTLHWFKEIIAGGGKSFLGASPLEAIFTSFIFALLAMVASVAFGMWVAYMLKGNIRGKSIIGVATMVPLCISTITLSLGYIVLENRISLDVSFWAIVIIHTIISFPFSVRAISASLAKIDEGLIDAARGLGASNLHAFVSIELPLLKGGIIAAAVFSFAISLGELAASFMLYGGRYTTIPIYIYRYIGGYRFGSAAAMGVVLMVVSAASFFIIERMGSKMQF